MQVQSKYARGRKILHISIDEIHTLPYNTHMSTETTKDKIIAAGIKLFSDNGFDGVGMRDIAGATDIAVSVLYYYYKNKEDLYTEIFYTYCEQTLKNVAQIVEESSSRSFREMCMTLFTRFKNLPDDEKYRLKVCITEIQRFGKPTILRDKIAKLFQQYEFLFFKLFESRVNNKQYSFATARVMYTFVTSKIADIVVKNHFSESSLRDECDALSRLLT